MNGNFPNSIIPKLQFTHSGTQSKQWNNFHELQHGKPLRFRKPCSPRRKKVWCDLPRSGGSCSGNLELAWNILSQLFSWIATGCHGDSTEALGMNLLFSFISGDGRSSVKWLEVSVDIINKAQLRFGIVWDIFPAFEWLRTVEYRLNFAHLEINCLLRQNFKPDGTTCHINFYVVCSTVGLVEVNRMKPRVAWHWLTSKHIYQSLTRVACSRTNMDRQWTFLLIKLMPSQAYAKSTMPMFPDEIFLRIPISRKAAGPSVGFHFYHFSMSRPCFVQGVKLKKTLWVDFAAPSWKEVKVRCSDTCTAD